MQRLNNILKEKKTLLILSLLALGLITRFAFLNYPPEVVFDEVHFGKFVSSYFTHEYYFDIHPPLGKMLIAGFARICGFNPGFDFSHIGETFDEKNLLILRFLPALFGAFLPIVIFLILRQLNVSYKFSFLGGLFVIFDNAILGQSKFILVDSMLLLFGFLSIYFYLLSNNTENKKRLGLLSLCAFFAALSLSIKWTGVLFLGIIGLVVIFKYIKKLNFKSLALDLSILILMPFIVYYLIFAVHFSLLQKSGPGNDFMSPQFNESLDNEIKMPLFNKFIELNKKMYFYNSTLSATHSFSSKWFQWPVSKKPIWYWSGSKENYYADIYLMGNIVEWLFVLAGIVFSVFAVFIKKIRGKLPYFFWFLLIGYFANLIPYIAVSRVTFLYHYLPSLIFGIMIFAALCDKIFFPYLDAKWGQDKKIGLTIYSSIIAAIILGFIFTAPITYGFKITGSANDIYINFLELFLNNK